MMKAMNGYNDSPYAPYNPQLTTTTVADNFLGQQSNCFGYTYWYPYYLTVEKEVEPKTCMGKAHVFECDHVTVCQCGKITRVMPNPPKKKSR